MKNIYLFLLSVVILCSCNDFLDREPKTNLSPGSFWKSERRFKIGSERVLPEYEPFLYAG